MANADDREFYELFSAFDDVSASDELKSHTIDAILANGETKTNGSQPKEDARPVVTTSSSHSKAGRKARWRAFRVAALAACLALALTGGVAWATPASYVEIAQDDTTIELGVNCFGVTVKASSNDDVGNEIIRSEELVNIPRDQSIERTVDSLEKSRPDLPIEVDGQKMPAANDAEPIAPPSDSNATPPNPESKSAGPQTGSTAPASYDSQEKNDAAEPETPPAIEGSNDIQDTDEPAAPEPEGGERQDGEPEDLGSQNGETGPKPDSSQQPNSPQGAGRPPG